MSGREWKPGDVALVESRDGDVEIGFCFKGGPISNDYLECAKWYTPTWTDGGVWSSVVSARPLIVIDPESGEQVLALCDAYRSVDHRIGAAHMQAALRSLIEPPKPEEPTGLGAVVEDAMANRWIRHGDGPAAWMLAGASPSNRDTYGYDGITAVRVLSEGVQ